MSSTKVRCANLKLDGWHTEKFCCQFSWKWGREVNDDIKFYGDIVHNSLSTSVEFVFLFDFSSRTNAKRTKWTTASRLHLLKNLYCTHALKWPLSPIHNPMICPPQPLSDVPTVFPSPQPCWVSLPASVSPDTDNTKNPTRRYKNKLKRWLRRILRTLGYSTVCCS